MTTICSEVEMRNWGMATAGLTLGTVALGVGALSFGVLFESRVLAMGYLSAASLSLAGLGAMGYVAAHKLYQADHPVSAVAVGVLATMVVAAALPTAGYFAQKALSNRGLY